MGSSIANKGSMGSKGSRGSKGSSNGSSKGSSKGSRAQNPCGYSQVTSDLPHVTEPLKMGTVRKVFCDHCNPNGKHQNHGIIDDCDIPEAISKFDWKVVNRKLICVDCQINGGFTE
jgi:hypothetical protein